MSWCGSGPVLGAKEIESAAAAQFQLDDALHFGLGRGFSGPDFKLPRALLDKHLQATDGGDSARLGEFEQGCFHGVIDHVEDQARVQFVFGDGQRDFGSAHPAGCGVDERVEACPFELLLREGVGFGFLCQSDGRFVGTVDDEDFGTLIDQAEDRGSGRAACAQQCDLRALQAEALLERADDPGDVGIESVDHAVGPRTEGVACADAVGQGVHVGQVGQHFLLERHRDGSAGQREFAEQSEQVPDCVYLEGQEHRVDALEAKSGVLHERRERIADGVASHSEDAGCLIELLDAVQVAQGAGADLAWSGLDAVAGRGKSESGTGPRAKYAAHDALLTHCDADEARGERSLVNQTQHGQIVGKREGCGNHLDEFRAEGLDAVGGLVEIGSAREVVKADEQRRACFAEGSAEGLQLGRAGRFGRFHFEVDDLAASLGCLAEQFQFGGQRTYEAAPVRLASAGGDRDYVAVGGQEVANGAQRFSRLRESVEAEFQETRILQSGCGTLDELGCGAGLDGDTHLAHAQAGRGRCGESRSEGGPGVCACHRYQLTHLKGLWYRMQGRIAFWQAGLRGCVILEAGSNAIQPGKKAIWRVEIRSRSRLWQSKTLKENSVMSIESSSAVAVPEVVHAWEAGGAVSPEALAAWVSDRLAAHQAALEGLLAVQEPRTPQNTLRLYDKAVEELNLAGSQAGILNSVASESAVRDQAQQDAQRVAMAGSALSLNRAVYEALSAIDLAGASEATRHYVARTLLSYRLAGVDKDQATRDRLQQLHEKASLLALEFSRNIQEGAKTIQATAEELDGLPADYVASHPVQKTGDEAGTIALTTDQPDMQPVMTFARSGALRERMFKAYNTRAYPVNRQILLDLLATRQEIATVLDFRSWADLATADQMMGSAASVREFLVKLNEASREGAEREHNLILEFARREIPALKRIDITSRAYWYEQYRRSAYAFDSQSVRPYFPYAQVEAGVLDTAAQLFKLTFRRSAAAAWHASVSVYDVFDGDRQVGRFYLDMHPREGKDKWFSAAPVVTGMRGGALPEAALICNFPGSGNDDPGADPGLLQYNDVVTYFHEFGHLMHAIVGGQTEWAGLSGFATEGDFIEVPSQMLEEFFRDEKLLQAFARHYQTGDVLPAEVIRKMKLAGSFGRADWVRSQLYYTTLSLDLHDQGTDAPPLDLDAMTRKLFESLQPWTWMDGNRMYASFGHLVGYSSNYYTYAFDKVIALDFFAQFDPNNLLGCDAGKRYRETVLEQGGSKPGRQMVRDFLGRDAEFEAFSRWLNEEFL